MDSLSQHPPVEMEPTTRSSLPSLTGLRFIAAFLVLLAHCIHVAVATTTTTFFFHFAYSCAYLGMTMFFVLSGFVIHYNYSERFLTRPFGSALWSFAVARFARLYPMYSLALLGGVVTTRLLSSLHDNSCTLPFHLSMTQSWLYLPTPSNMIVDSLYPPTWSISTEIFFYFFFPLLLVPVSQLRKPRAILICVGIFVTCSFVLLSLLCLQQEYLFGWLTRERWRINSLEIFTKWIGYYFPVVRFLEFALGCLCAQIYLCLSQRSASARETRAGLFSMIAALSLVILVMLIFVTGKTLDTESELFGVFSFLETNFLNAPACGVLCFCAVRYKTVFSRFLNLPTVVHLGDASYSIYLLQHFTFGSFGSSSRPITLNAFIDWTIRLALIIGLVFAVSLSAY